MGFMTRLFSGEPLVPEAPDLGPVFSTSIDPGTLYGVQTLDQAMAYFASSSRRIPRTLAITVPAIIAARNRICALGQLPLRLHGPDGAVVGDVVAGGFLAKPEATRTASHTWTWLLDDLIFEGRGFIARTYDNAYGYPAEGVRLDAASVTAQAQPVTHRTPSGTTGITWEYPEDPHLIRIDSPKDPLLVAGARAINTLLRLEVAALNAAEGVPPHEFFTPDEGAGADPFADKAEVVEFLDEWKTARKERSTGYVPYGVKHNANQFNPEQLQLVGAREIAIAEIARLTGLDGEDLNVPTTSRTYFNAQDRRRNFLDFVGGPYPGAIEDRLSEDDVTPPGHTARFDLSAFMQADDLTLAQTDEILSRSKLMDLDELRERRGLGPRPQTPAQETADV